LPDTALSQRLIKEGRLLDTSSDINQTTLMNFVPTRPIEDIAREYVDGFWALYDPQKFLDRTFRCYQILGQANYPKKEKKIKKPFDWQVVKAGLIVLWSQGVVRSTRWTFWPYLFWMVRHNSGGLLSYLTICSQIEHFLEYRQLVKDGIEEQLAAYLAHERDLQAQQAEQEQTVAAIAS
ncbi:MAG: DUF4070 domain-containing protein, partial [Spirulina sp. SIO3F2]|nr:DUF4070 domain-containing protein [Spirulina sp. SIO3F2]